MKLTQLQSLLAINEAKAPAPASKKNTSDFDGIKAIVEDALGDLSDKLGKGGSLSTLMKSSGADKVDKTVLKNIVEKTAEYKKAIERLLMDADFIISQLDEELITEGKEFEDSAEFTDEFYGIHQDVMKLKGKMKAPRWMSWMKSTDANFSTECVEPAKNAIRTVDELSRLLDEIDAEFDKAN